MIRESSLVGRVPGTVASSSLFALLLCCCRRCWRRDKTSLVQRVVLARVGKFVINVSRRSVRLSCNRCVEFCGALGFQLVARGDICEIPPPMCGGVLSICWVTWCVVWWFPLRVLAWLGCSSLLSLIGVRSRALGIISTNLVLISRPRGQSSLAGFAGTVRLRVHTFWTSAPANAGLGLAVLIGAATGTTKKLPEMELRQS